ncbi:thioredoxin reductase (NADPH) [Geodermatophilus dictyosporus]|uniref:Ferredoxin--NADP reductase n=1 Tax=Geodermatophilus dictyosporus TaxID=1523247 RepID=A0A1I5JKX4_9ACTN|nr:NAD(P)/FAD-dependent oxidoreductase [Geodermatophilus dictyosporus]SFO73339.1 thioredoxin reductase (NADPH) [Geodermatophilus dictyosporus]
MTATDVLTPEHPAAAGREVHVDLLVVGAGPAGLYAAYYAGFRGLRTAVVDSLPEPGGQVTALYPEKLIHDVAGFPGVKGRDLVADLVQQAARFDPVYVLGEQSETLTNEAGERPRAGDRLVVTTDRGTRVHCGAVVVTGGIGTFTPRPLPGGDRWEGRGLTYVVRELAAHAGQDVVIVGGGDSAVDWALALEDVAASVTLVHRRRQFRAHAASVADVQRGRTVVVTDAQVSGLEGDDRLHTVHVRAKDGTVTPHRAQAIIAALGFTADIGPLERWGVDTADRRIVVDTAMRTNVAGVYSAGDITEYAGKVRLIAVGFGEAATAVNNAATYLDPDQPLFPGHSSDDPAGIGAAASA